MILLTGAAGFLGKSVLKSLLEIEKDSVRCLVRPGTNNYAHIISDIDNKADVEICPCSLHNIIELKKALEGVDKIIHLAASKIGSVSTQVANTVVGTDILLKACKEIDIDRFVLCSSFGVIGAAIVKKNTLIDEKSPLEAHPEKRDPYSFVKKMQEDVAWEYHNDYGLPLVVIRPGVILGPPSPILSSRIGLNLFGIFLHLGGNNKIPFSYKDNCADAIVKACYTPGVEGEAFCISDDDLPTSKYVFERYKKEVLPLRSISIPFWLLKLISKLNVEYSAITRGHLPEVFTPYKVDSMWKGHDFSNKKAKRMLGWNPQIPMEEALKLTYEYFVNIH